MCDPIYHTLCFDVRAFELMQKSLTPPLGHIHHLRILAGIGRGLCDEIFAGDPAQQ
jgi:hypothetical protein